MGAEAALDANAARINRAFAGGLRPPPRISVSDWAAENRRFGEDSAYPGPWDRSVAPYLDEIMDCLSPHHPASVVSIIKCAQSGGSASGENWIGYVADVAPGPMMYVGPTITAAKDWLAEKFWPMVEATPRLNPDRSGVVMPKRQRDGAGTTALRTRFRKGGWMLVAGANSAATLRQHSIRYAIEDDLDQFPDDLDHQGAPESMVTARLTVFTRQGIAKRLKISTPTNAGASKIEVAVKAGDQRRYYFACRHCGSRFDPQFADLRWPDGRPDQVELVAPCCGVPLAHWEKPAMSRADGWLATFEDDGEKPPRVMDEATFQDWRAQRPAGTVIAGRQPSFDISGIISSFLTWSDLCDSFVKAQGDQNKLRSWTNLMLGQAFSLKGDAPPAESLEALREQDWDKTAVPHGPAVFTLGCDVQGDGIYYEALGWAFGLENWSLDHGFLPGATDVPGEGAWKLLEDYSRRTFAMPGGKAIGFDFICVDAGYNTEAAKAFCKRSGKRLPVFGRDGWMLPILGRSMAVHHEVGKSNRRKRTKRAGEDAHLVGTFGAKFSFYGFLRTSIAAADAEARGQGAEPMRGRIHFGRHADVALFDMLTSESVVTEVKNGLKRRVWRLQPGRQNHWLDCRIYNRAAAEAMALDSRAEADWLALREDRYASPTGQADLVARMNSPIPTASAPFAGARTPDAPPAASPGPAARDNETWVPDREGWL